MVAKSKMKKIWKYVAGFFTLLGGILIAFLSGKGAGSMEAGRRFRSVADAGRVHPHEAKRLGQHPKSKITTKTRKKIGGKTNA